MFAIHCTPRLLRVVFNSAAQYGFMRIQLPDTTSATVSVDEASLTDPIRSDALAASVRAVLQNAGEGRPVELTFAEPLLSNENAYIGSSACATCHAQISTEWSTTPHGAAIKSLQRLQYHEVANCVACHVVGYGQRSGYSLADPDADLLNVGCEVCHGPGRLHASDPSTRFNIRRAPSDSLCSTCHTLEHSRFLLGPSDLYRARVDHHAVLTTTR